MGGKLSSQDGMDMKRRQDETEMRYPCIRWRQMIEGQTRKSLDVGG
jgi:hypothetical protein